MDLSEDAAQRRALPSLNVERRVVLQIQNSKRLLQILGGQAPIVVMITLIGVNGWQMAVRPDISGSNDTFDRDPVFIPETLIATFDGNRDVEAKVILNLSWNAAGWPSSPNFDDSGRWTGGGR